MTDLDRLKKTFDEIGVKYEYYTVESKDLESCIDVRDCHEYSVLSFCFDKEGKFKVIYD